MTMPDRAVVTYHESNFWKDNSRWIVRDGSAPLHESDVCEMCGCDACILTWIPSDQLPARFVGSPGEWLCQCCDPEPQPRAIVALSEDRQWLVVLFMLTEDSASWSICQLTDDFLMPYRLKENIPDTGQDAHDVLNEFLDDEFLAGRQG